MKNVRNPLLMIALFALLSACNLYGGLSKPSNDEQHLDAARACMDRNDYPCALEHYRAISDSSADVRINETSLAELAQAGVFSFSDLITALGTSLGNGRTLSAMAELIAGRGAMTSSNRLIIQKTFVENAKISDSNKKLKAFSKFISAITMFNVVLASAVGPDGILRSSDISSGSTCASDYTTCGPPGSGLLPDTDGSGDPTNLGNATNWDHLPSIEMLWLALDAAKTEAGEFTGSQSGVIAAINQLLNLDPLIPAPDRAKAKRQQLILTMGLQ